MIHFSVAEIYIYIDGCCDCLCFVLFSPLLGCANEREVRHLSAFFQSDPMTTGPHGSCIYNHTVNLFQSLSISFVKSAEHDHRAAVRRHYFCLVFFKDAALQ